MPKPSSWPAVFERSWSTVAKPPHPAASGEPPHGINKDAWAAINKPAVDAAAKQAEAAIHYRLQFKVPAAEEGDDDAPDPGKITFEMVRKPAARLHDRAGGGTRTPEEGHIHEGFKTYRKAGSGPIHNKVVSESLTFGGTVEVAGPEHITLRPSRIRTAGDNRPDSPMGPSAWRPLPVGGDSEWTLLLHFKRPPKGAWWSDYSEAAPVSTDGPMQLTPYTTLSGLVDGDSCELCVAQMESGGV
eukprot:SAG22_NODE_1998_length_3183_cov_1.660830_2_plen_243_part_00